MKQDMTEGEVLGRREEVKHLIARALAEDVGVGDATTESLVSYDCVATASIVSRGAYVLAGIDIAQLVFHAVEAELGVKILVQDGQRIEAGTELLQVEGAARAILVAERTALNFLQRMTGIATLTHAFVRRVAGRDVVILDTRKTTPNLRLLEKYAVTCGGGANHRMGLYDRVLIKDNHRRLWARTGGGTLADAVRRSREKHPDLQIEIEVESVAELREVLDETPDWVLLDNMSNDELRECVELAAGRCKLEASGGITLENVEDVAATGVNAISLGCLTHSAPAADLALEMGE